jgi:hypothetical protein
MQCLISEMINARIAEVLPPLAALEAFYRGAIAITEQVGGAAVAASDDASSSPSATMADGRQRIREAFLRERRAIVERAATEELMRTASL